MNPKQSTVLLVPGGWHGSWCWGKVIDALAAHGVTARAVDLPSSGEDVASLADMHADIAVVRADIEAIGGPVIVVGHSYAGMVITGAATGMPQVQHLVYVAAFMPDADETVLVGFSENSHAWSVEKHGARHVPREVARATFFHDCDAATQEWALDQLASYSSGQLRQQTPGSAAWREVDSTYVVCNADRAMPVEAQRRQAARATYVKHLVSGHSPFLSQPGEFAAILADLVRGPSGASARLGGAEVPPGNDNAAPRAVPVDARSAR